MLVTLDTTRADRLGCYGRLGAATPSLDALARGGVLFENALSPAPITLVSHATMLTGLAPRRHGVRDNAGFRLDGSHPTLATILKANGYRTAAAVSSAVLDRSTGIGRGFDTFDDRVRVGARSELNFEERAASQVTAAARGLLDSLQPPFFLWVHYYDPHAPYVPPPSFRTRFKANPYEGEIAFMDQGIGKLLEALDARGQTARTLIVVAGDHGESLGEHGEDKHDLFVYQATQRVPLLIRGPRAPAGRRVARNVGLVDLLPSILDLLGLPPVKGIDGESLVPLFDGGAKAGGKQPAYEMESLFPAYSYNWAPTLAVVEDRYKYIATPKPELYDLRADPAELRNLLGASTVSTDTRATAARLAAVLRQRHASDAEPNAFGAPYCSPAVSLGCTPIVPPTATKSVGDEADEDEERRQRLASLGYVGGSASPSRPPPPGPHRDPKDGAAIVRDLDRARELLQAGKPTDAARILEPLARAEARNFPLRATLGSSLLASGSFDRAIEIHRATVALSPDYGIAHANLAGALRAKAASLGGGKDPRASALNDEAAAELDRALRLNPRDSESYLRAAELEVDRSRTAAARDILARADAADAGDPEIYLLLGKLQATLGDTAKARAAFKKVLDFDPRSGEAHESLGRLAYLANDPRTAAEHYAKALELTPTVAIAKTLGSIRLYALKDRSGALDAFRRAATLTRDPAELREIEDAIREAEAAR